MSNSNYPTLSQTIPIYNYLIDIIEEFLESEHLINIIEAANFAKNKLQEYYPSSDGLVYVISTSMYIFCVFIINKILTIFILLFSYESTF